MVPLPVSTINITGKKNIKEKNIGDLFIFPSKRPFTLLGG